MTTIGRYTILDKINHSRMSMVYKCYDPLLEKELVIKFLSHSLKKQYSIISEAKILSSLSHPNIIRFFNYDICSKTHIEYIILEFLSGLSLNDFILTYSNVLSLTDKIQIFLSILNTIQFIHNHKIIHLDIKPENIFIEKNLQTKILDFGLAQKQDSYNSTKHWITGSIDFISPEQIVDNDISYHSDIYTLGCLLYFIVTNGKILDDEYDILNKITRKSKHLTGLSMSIDNPFLHDIILGMLKPVKSRKTLQEVKKLLINNYILDNYKL